jgi:prepilin-type N-terminal cleavage/methylation domain-containing protein/prepilin-type processing-associated H-X9-DG protein
MKKTATCRRNRITVFGFRHRGGFTLLELVVVLAIILLIVGLIVPCIQRAREAASLAQCSNNLRQIGIALQNSHDAYRRFPSAGWGWRWLPVPDRGPGPEQPGSWLYNVLVFTEHNALRHLGVGQISPNFQQSMVTLLTTPVPLFNCPSRRDGGPFSTTAAWPYLVGMANGTTTLVSANQQVRSDYAGNAGSQGFNELGSGPSSLAQGDSASYAWPTTKACSGVFFLRSSVALPEIELGTSNTFAAGERYIDSDHYADGLDNGDNECMYVGFENDVARTTVMPPQQDRARYKDTRVFGSAHSFGVNMLYCDGAVQHISYSVDPDVFFRAGRRLP